MITNEPFKAAKVERVSYVLSESLGCASRIYNLALGVVAFLGKLKLATVLITIFKGGNKTMVVNNGPIPMFPVLFLKDLKTSS